MAETLDINKIDFSDLSNYPNIGYNKDGELMELSFNGNILIRPYNSMLPMTEEAQAEYVKCSEDFFYFMETYCYIHTQDYGKILVKLRDYQRDFIQLIHDESRVIGNLARQIGKTSSVSLYIVWCLCFQKDWIGLIVANEDDLKKEIVDMIQSIYENLPPFLQSGIVKWNMGSIELSNGCKIKSAVAGKNAGRGKTPSLILSDEMAWYDDEKAKAFFDSAKASLSSGTKNKFIIISTPRGYNLFHKYWKDACEGISKFKSFFANWKAVPGRDEEWKRNKMAEDNMTALEWAQNYEGAFLGSSLTLLSVDSLSKLSKTNPLVEDYIVPGAKLYREFNPEAKYLITVDTSKTVEKQNSENDYISLNVLELTETSIEQALTFRSNDIHYTDMSEIIYQIGEAFDYPWVVVENNEGAGQSIVDNLHSEYEYPNIYADPKHNGEILGIRTTTSRRPLALSSLKKLVELDIFNIYDADTIDEFFTFVKIGKKYQASSGATDDCIMSLSLVGTFLSDENNDLEITLKDYLKSEVTIERNNDDDLDFFSGTRTQEDIDTYYLLEGKDY